MHFSIVHGDAFSGDDDEAEVLTPVGVELALLGSESAIGFVEVSEDSSDMLGVFDWVFGVDDDVIEVCRTVEADAVM